MTRPSKNTQGRRTNLKKANAALYSARQKASNEPFEIINLPLSSDSDDENNETNLAEELISCEVSELDNKNTALELFNRLFKQAKTYGRPAIYTGLAPRTIRQKKQHLREAAI
ncbi:10776_t:CDS:1, partial [Diversispora eburnea]